MSVELKQLVLLTSSTSCGRAKVMSTHCLFIHCQLYVPQNVASPGGSLPKL
jgi:hypothetical protein